VWGLGPYVIVVHILHKYCFLVIPWEDRPVEEPHACLTSRLRGVGGEFEVLGLPSSLDSRKQGLGFHLWTPHPKDSLKRVI
jgi:hypothetical protein